MFRTLLFILFLCILNTNLAFSQGFKAGALNAVFTDTAPSIDGVVEDIWNNTPELAVVLGETKDIHDPSSITDCAGCHSYGSSVDVKLKAVYTTDRLYVLATWPDPTASFTRGGSWSFANSTWEKPNSVQSEDRISFFWPIGDITGNPYSTGGCMAKCHMYWPTDTDPHVSSHGIVDDAWLESGRGDMWHSKAARGGAFLSASGSNLTIDPTSHEVTAGTFSMTGYADDKYVDVWAHDSLNGEDGGRYGDSGTSAYSHNRIGDKSRPKYMEKAPADYADAMILTQSEIDAGECVGDATTGVSDADATTYWSAYTGFNAVVPERILRQPAGSRGDIDFGAVWKDGFWTAELARDLDSGSDEDIQFDITEQYLFGVAEFDNSRHGYEHRTSDMYSMRFDLSVDIEDQKADVPHSFNLLQNYPNPFNPVTTISYELPKSEFVNIIVYNSTGQIVASLVNKQKQAGFHSIKWDAKDFSSGLYFYRIIAGQYSAVKKCIVLK